MKMVFVPPLLTFATCAVISMACPSNAQASLVNIETVLVGDAGNAAKVGYPVGGVGYNGSISYEYRIGKYEVTIEQYVVFLNSVASITAEDHLIELWASAMMVSRTGSGTELDPFKYSALGSGKRPIGCISWFDAARFCNWLHNGATNGASTETGAYELNGATYGIIDKNDNATWWIPSLDEWCKAAYYKAGGTNSGYWTYPTQSDDRPGNQVGGAANQANYFRDGIYSLTQNTTAPPSVEPSQDYFTDVGVFSNSPSAYGTFDQAGNVWEWTDAHFQGLVTAFIGGSWRNGESALSGASPAGTWGRHQQWSDWGFRVATVAKAQVTDSDNDGVNDYRENKDGTDPNDPNSFNPLSKGLVAYYPFDGNANDESGYGNNGTLNGPVLTADRSGMQGEAYLFNGTSDFIDMGNGSSVNFGTNNFTLSAWIKPDPACADSYIISKYRNPELSSFGLGTATPCAYAFLSGTNPMAGFPAVKGSKPILDNRWHLLTAVYTRGELLRVYLDGRLDSVGDISSAVGSVGNSLPLVIGALAEGSTWGRQYFKGGIDEVRLYNRALSQHEAERLYYLEAFTDEEMTFLEQNPDVMGHYSQNEYDSNRTNGQTDVTTNPAAFNLFTQSQFDSNRIAGQQDVIASPMTYGLYDSNSIMDLRMGGLMIQRQGTNTLVSFQPQTTTDLTQPFTNNGTPITHEVPMPGNKGFLRINAKP